MRLCLLPVVLACTAPVFMVTTSLAAAQIESERTARSSAHIDCITQSFHSLAVNPIVTGSRFPAKSSTRKVRLVAEGTGGLARGEVFFASGHRTWTPTRIEDFLQASTTSGSRQTDGSSSTRCR